MRYNLLCTTGGSLPDCLYDCKALCLKSPWNQIYPTCGLALFSIIYKDCKYCFTHSMTLYKVHQLTDKCNSIRDNIIGNSETYFMNRKILSKSSLDVPLLNSF